MLTAVEWSDRRRRHTRLYTEIERDAIQVPGRPGNVEECAAGRTVEGWRGTPARQDSEVPRHATSPRRRRTRVGVLAAVALIVVGPKDLAAIQGRFGQTSQFFRLRTRITLGSTEFTLYSLLQRSSGGKITPLLRSFGTP